MLQRMRGPSQALAAAPHVSAGLQKSLNRLGNQFQLLTAIQPSRSQEVVMLHNVHGVPCLGMTAANPPAHAPPSSLFSPLFSRMMLLQPNAMSTWARVAAQQAWMTTSMTQQMTMSMTLCNRPSE